jgi:tripartite-type tricarboxylate transporter receptor subunit TctC
MLRPREGGKEKAMAFMRRSVCVMLGVALLAGWATPSRAQAWPQRTVRFILTLGAGSGTDIGGRLLADRLTKKWGQPVVIENKPGGDAIVAINAFVSAKDDHILLLSPTSAFIAHPFLHENLPYRPSDLAPIARVSNTIIGISVPASLPANSMKELVALARSKPGELNWAGITGALDFNFAGWAKSLDLDMKKVPYRNPVDAVNDLAENRVQVFESAVAIAQPQIMAGKIKLLAVLNSVRAPVYPDTPTVADAGFPTMSIDGLVGLFGPPTMPLAQREKIAADIKEVMDADQIIKDRLMATAQIFNPGGPEDLAKAIEDQRAKLAQNARDLGVKAKQ